MLVPSVLFVAGCPAGTAPETSSQHYITQMTDQAQSGAQPTLIFIPDISGFTRFVTETEISHSQHIIEELLEVLIDANEMDLEVSEIEGDAILFFRDGQAPTMPQILAQVQKMYVDFHTHIRRYDTHRICQCGACCSAIELSLKFVLHFGEVARKQVKEHRKLFGKDVIVAHRLLKNEIEEEEYVLLTHDLVNACSTWVQIEESSWAKVEKASGEYDFGAIEFCFIPLTSLQNYVVDPPVGEWGLGGRTVKANEYEIVVEVPLEKVFNALSDVAIRHEWIPGIKDSTEMIGNVTRNGTTHRCVMAETEDDPFFFSHSFDKKDNVITFVETEPKMKMEAFYSLHRIGKKLTRIHRADYIPRGFLGELKYRLKSKKMMSGWVGGAFENFKSYAEGLEEAGKEHPAQIVL